MTLLTLIPGQLSWQQHSLLLNQANQGRYVRLDPSWQTASQDNMSKTVSVIQAMIDQKKTVYGVNTGFGRLANTQVSSEDLDQLQTKILLSHAAGVGQPMPLEVVHLALLLKINSLARGFSGVRPLLVKQLAEYFNRGLLPKIPEKGSVGASGDLAPLAHLALPLIGKGEMWYQNGWQQSQDVLSAEGLLPIVLGPKEGLALLNGTQISTAYALTAAWRLESLLKHAMIMGAMTLEAVKGSRVPFDARIHELRNLAAQQRVAELFRALLPKSPISKSHENCSKVQDPYSLRCQPQVLGACLHQWLQAKPVLVDEANGVTDNPLLFADTQEALSGGNFHAEPVAMAADNMALAFAEIGALSERRLALLMDSQLSGLPPFLVEQGGLNSGFMIAQVTAAALASENKQLATPSSVDSLPTSANQEDVVSMATYASRRLLTMAENTSYILAIEWLAAAQGCDFHRPLTPSAPIASAIDTLRTKVDYYQEDRLLNPDIEAAKDLISTNELLDDYCVDLSLDLRGH